LAGPLISFCWVFWSLSVCSIRWRCVGMQAGVLQIDLCIFFFFLLIGSDFSGRANSFSFLVSLLPSASYCYLLPSANNQSLLRYPFYLCSVSPSQVFLGDGCHAHLQLAHQNSFHHSPSCPHHLTRNTTHLADNRLPTLGPACFAVTGRASPKMPSFPRL
jgi:hypothetical protein